METYTIRMWRKEEEYWKQVEIVIQAKSHKKAKEEANKKYREGNKLPDIISIKQH